MRAARLALTLAAMWMVGCGAEAPPPKTPAEGPAAPPPGSAAFDEGVAAVEAADWATAAAKLREAVDADPTNAEAAFYLAVALQQTGDAAGAAAQYEAALENDPELIDAYVNYSALLLEQGNTERGLQVVADGLGKVPDHADLLLNRALLLEEAKSPDAVAAYDQAVAANPANEALRLAYAALLVPVDPKKAVGELDRLAAETKEARIAVEVARLFQQLEEPARCVPLMDRFIAARPHPGLSVQKGTCQLDQKAYPDAIATFEAAIALDEKFAPAHYYLGRALEESGKGKQAVASYDKAVELGGDAFVAKDGAERAAALRKKLGLPAKK